MTTPRQALVPGGAYMNETKNQQALVPGQQYVNETIQTTTTQQPDVIWFGSTF